MRIIAGKMRSRRLRGPHGHDLRPTSDRLRETLFDILGDRVLDSMFIDAFAGTGAVGLEALSRGAREVVFIESNRNFIKLIQQNLDLCGVSTGYRLLHRDAAVALRQLGFQGIPCDFMYVDPPYHWADYERLLDEIFRCGPVKLSSLIMLEHHIKASLPANRDPFLRTRVVKQGDHGISFFVASDQRDAG